MLVMYDSEQVSSMHFYLWSYAGEPGMRFAYWEFVDKLVSVGIPFDLASKAVMSMVDGTIYFDIDESDGLYFIKRSDSSIGN